MKISNRYLSNPRSRKEQTKAPCITSLNSFHVKRDQKKKSKKAKIHGEFKIVMQKAKEEFINQETKTQMNSPHFSNAKINLNIFQNFMLNSLKTNDVSPIDQRKGLVLNSKYSLKNSWREDLNKYSKIRERDSYILGIETNKHSTQTQTGHSDNLICPEIINQISSHNFLFNAKSRDSSSNHLCNFSSHYPNTRKLPVKSKLSMNSINSVNSKNSKNSQIEVKKLNTSTKGRANDLRGLNTCEMSRQSSKLNIHDEKNHKFPDLFFKLKKSRIPFKIQLMLIK